MRLSRRAGTTNFYPVTTAIFDVIGPKLMQYLGIASISRLMRADAIKVDAS
jgi:hypothetical protein